MKPSVLAERVATLVWGAGARSWRVARRFEPVARFEPFVWRVALRALPPAEGEFTVTLPSGDQAIVPARYRDGRILAAGLYERGVTSVLRQFLREGMTFVDVGAYLGYHSLVAASLVGKTGHVYSFEPDPYAFDVLKRNIDHNALSQIVAINQAVTASSEQQTYARDPYGAEGSLLRFRQSGDRVSISTVSLDDFFGNRAWPGVDVVKLDVEGSEMLALTGMRELNGRNPNMTLIMEYNPPSMKAAGVTRDQLEATLVELGFCCGYVVENACAMVKPPALLPTTRTIYNVLLTKRPAPEGSPTRSAG